MQGWHVDAAAVGHRADQGAEEGLDELRAVDVVQKKRDGGELTREEIEFFVRGYSGGEIPDYQAAAFAMAVFFRGMTPAEIVALTG